MEEVTPQVNSGITTLSDHVVDLVGGLRIKSVADAAPLYVESEVYFTQEGTVAFLGEVDFAQATVVNLAAPPGPQGLTGSEGPEGPRGERGEKGEQGIMGPTGVQGLAGVPGPQGERGERGEKGAQGDRGVDGIGVKGEPGPEGPAGAQGTPGVGIHAIASTTSEGELIRSRGISSIAMNDSGTEFVYLYYLETPIADSAYNVQVTLNEHVNHANIHVTIMGDDTFSVTVRGDDIVKVFKDIENIFPLGEENAEVFDPNEPIIDPETGTEPEEVITYEETGKKAAHSVAVYTY